MEKLGIIVKVDGTIEASNGLKLTGQGATQLGKDLDAMGSKTASAAQEQKALAATSEKTTNATNLLARATTTLVGAFAGFSLLNLVRESALLASRFETMGVVMRIAGNNAGYTGAQMEAYSKQLQNSGISMLESRNSLTQLATANIDLANATKLGRAAQDLAVVGNVNSSEALNRLIYGVKSGQVEVLRTIGLNVSFEGSYKKLADQLGVTTESLSGQQKMMARTNVVIEEAARYNGIYEESMTTAGKAMGSLTRHWENFKVQAGDAFLPTLATSVFSVTAAFESMNTELARAGQDGLIDEVGRGLNGTLKTGIQTGAVLVANFAYMFKVLGLDIGATAAQFMAFARGDFKGALSIGQALEDDFKVARAGLDAFEKKILGVQDAAKKAPVMTEGQRMAAGEAGKVAAAAADKTASQNAALLDFTKKYGTEAQKNKIATDEWKAKLGELYTPELAAMMSGKVSGKASTAKSAPAESNAAESYIAGLNKQMRAASDEASAYATVMEYLTINAKKFNFEQYQTAAALALAIDEQKKLRELAQIREKNNQQADREVAAQERELDGLIKTNDGLRQQAEQVGLTKDKLSALTLTRLDAVIAQERENLVGKSNIEGAEAEVAVIERKIRLLEEQRGLTQTLTAKTDAADKTKAAEDASRKFGEDVRRDLKDGLIRGFEAGKNPAHALADTMGNIIKQRLVSAFADSILNSFEPLIRQVMGRIQMPGGGGGGGGIGGAISGILGGVFGTTVANVMPGDALDNFINLNSAFGTAHTGGVVGADRLATKMLNPAVFKGASRFHKGGIAGDEVPIIARKGEGIFTEQQMASLAPAGGGAAPTINIYTPAGMKAETKQRKGADGGMNVDVMISAVEDALADRMGAGSGALYGAMSDRFGLRTQVG